MVWNEKSSVIVMLTQTFECIKVMSAQYWPNKIGQTEKYGEFSLTLVQEDTFADYKVNKYLIDITKKNWQTCKLKII